MTSETLSSKLELWHDLTGKVVMVTGASSGLGREFCLDLAKSGCKIVATARRIDRLVSLCEEINRLGCTTGVQAVALKLDITAEGSIIEATVRKAWEAFGRIDALINNAGVRDTSTSSSNLHEGLSICGEETASKKSFMKKLQYVAYQGREGGTIQSPLTLSEEEWDNTMRTNLTGQWLVSKYVCKLMCNAKQRGSIINIASIAGINRGELRGGLAYVCSKAGIVPLTKVMAMELGTCNIRVNSIHPGLFKSEITKGLLEEERVKNAAKKGTPMGTFGTGDLELTKLARFLIHDCSNYISGNVFIVDLGTSLPGVPIFSAL